MFRMLSQFKQTVVGEHQSIQYDDSMLSYGKDIRKLFIILNVTNCQWRH